MTKFKTHTTTGGAKETFTIPVDDAPSLRFTGYELARVNSQNPEGSRLRWTELALYVTVAGQYVALQVGRSTAEGEHDRYAAAVLQQQQDVIEYFGHGRLAKRLYAEWGKDDVQEIS